MEEWECPDCGFITIPKVGQISDPTFTPEEGYIYTEYVCPTCETILLTTRKPTPIATIVRIDGSQEDLYFEPSLEDLQQAIGGWVEWVPATDAQGNTVKLAVDGDGKPKNRPVNKFITERYGQSIYGGYVVGNVVILYQYRRR